MRAALVVPELRQIMPRDSFTYAVPDELDAAAVPGCRVEVPFGQRSVLGVVVERLELSHRVGEGPAARNERSRSAEAAGSRPNAEQPSTPAPPQLRELGAVLDEEPPLLPHQVALCRWVSERYMAPLGEVVKAMLPKGVRAARPGGRKRGPRTTSVALEAARAMGAEPAETPPQLTAAQDQVVAPIVAAVGARQPIRRLLHGVTGSGKTEVYLRAIEAALGQGRQAIVLVPEISLTPQTIRRFGARFPGRLALIHSGLTEAERAAEWRRIRAGLADVVVGSRSAVFAPLPRLGVVIVDEEDASAYKQDRVPRYSAVEAALELGRLASVPVLLGSATPRVETFYRAHVGDLDIARLPERVGGRPLPPIEVVDLREELHAGNRSALSLTLERALAECHDAGGQSILFLNRRGTATVMLCRDCGEPLMCPNCSVSLVYHASLARCDCHYCGATAPVPRRCPLCRSPAVRALGMGTERLEAEVAERFPRLRLLRMDRDTVQARDAYFEIYERFRRGDADCLIGTQMVAKGWDLAGVRLVGIVNADTSLRFPDYRSGEVTFSLLTQVAGRAGRGDEPARVVLQTYSPDHYAVRHAVTHDYLGFAREEIVIRRRLRFPPYARMITCTVAAPADADAEARAREAAATLLVATRDLDDIDLLGPSPAFIHRLRGEHRWQLTLRGQGLERVTAALPRARGWSIDVDPGL